MKLTASLLLGLVAGTTAASSTELKSMVAKKLKIDHEQENRLLKTQLNTTLATIATLQYGSNSSTKKNQDSSVRICKKRASKRHAGEEAGACRSMGCAPSD